MSFWPHRLAASAFGALAVLTFSGCTSTTATAPPTTGTAATSSAPANAGVGPGVGNTTPLTNAPPRTVDPARRSDNLNQMIDALGLDPPQRSCVAAAIDADPALSSPAVDTRTTTRALLQHGIDCGAREQLTTKFLSAVAPGSPSASNRDCVKTAFDRLDASQFIALITGDPTLSTQLDADITKACPTTTTP